MKICVTGHRPNKLYGYNLLQPKYFELIHTFKDILKEEECTEAITGMALGTDTIFAVAVLSLKKEEYDIKLHCAIPCKNHTKMWRNPDDIKRYHKILDKADIVKIVTEKEY